MVVPVVAVLALVLTWGRHPGPVVVGLVALVLAGAVLAAVQHAELIAHRLGEPFGSLVLAVAVTVIEVALIVTLMVSGGPKTASLARDTVFAAVMITINGIVGLSLLAGARRFGVSNFNPEGTGAALASVVSVTTHQPGAADVHLERPGAALLARPARVRGGRLAGRLRAVRADPDGPAPRLLPAGDRQRRDRAAGGARRAAHRPAGVDQPGPADAGAGRRGGAGQGRVALDRGRREGRRLPAVVRRRRDRAAGAAAGDAGGVPGRGARPGADQPEPVLRLGDGQHRADHPGDRGGLDLARRPAAARAWARCRSRCSR